MAERMIAFFFFMMAAIPIFIIGIVQYKSILPVGFWSGKEPPTAEQITDIPAYNHRHGIMWMLYGSGMLISYLVGFSFGGMTAMICVGVECFGGLFGMIAYHNWLDRKYNRR